MWPPLDSASSDKEKKVVQQLCSIPLCPAGSVTVEATSDLVSLVPGIKSDNLGIGSVSTWHGTPDIRVKGVEVIVKNLVEEEAWDSYEEGMMVVQPW